MTYGSDIVRQACDQPTSPLGRETILKKRIR
jgi:hypothetical protein